MASDQKQKSKKVARQTNVLEALKDIGTNTGKTIKEDLFDKFPEDLRDQFFAPLPDNKKYSGNIYPGETMQMNQVFSGEREEKAKLQMQLTLERNLRQEEESLRNRKSQELRVQLNALTQKVSQLAQKTTELSEQTKIAAMQAPVEPGEYHINFFENLLRFIESFVEKIDDALVWMNTSNKRAQKKNNFWSKYKKSGSSFLLSPDHYLTRSAG